jgi:hypothetical protein
MVEMSESGMVSQQEAQYTIAQLSARLSQLNAFFLNLHRNWSRMSEIERQRAMQATNQNVGMPP